MHVRSRTWKAAAMLLITGMVAVACADKPPGQITPSAGSQAQQPPQQSEAEKEFRRTLLVGSGLDITSVDPQVLTALAGAVVTRNVYETLVRFKGNTTEVEGVLATAWDISPDGKEYTFTLRQGVKFHDGTDFNADAVKFTFDRLFGINKGPVNNFAMVDKVTVIDPYKVKFTLKYPFKPFLQILGGLFGGQIVSPAAVKANEKNGDRAQEWMQSHAVGTGPYKLESTTQGDRTVLVKHDAYWGGWDGQHVERIILRYVREAASQRQLLERGEIDIAEGVLLEDIPLLQKNQDISVQTFPTLTSFYIYFHTQRGPLSDPRVRQALSYAVDYDKIIKSAMQGYAKQLKGPIPEGMWGHDPNVALYKRDVAKAKQLMAEAGYPNSGFELEYMYIGLDYQRIIGEILQSNWADLGVKVKLESVTVAAGRQRRERPETSPDMFIYYSVPKFADPDALAFDLFSSKGQPPRGANWGWYKNERVDQLLDQARLSNDVKEREALYKEVQGLVAKDAPAIFLMNTNENIISRKWVKGLTYNMMYSRALYYYPVHKEP